MDSESNIAMVKALDKELHGDLRLCAKRCSWEKQRWSDMRPQR